MHNAFNFYPIIQIMTIFLSKMVEIALLNNPTRKLKQPISVPFLWETKPGLPKNNWKPVKPSRPPPPPPTHALIKSISSVPLEWEENPEKPFQNISQPTTESRSQKEKRGNDETEIIFESFNFQTEESCNTNPLQLENNLILQEHHPVIPIAPVPLRWEETHGKPLHFLPKPLTDFGSKLDNYSDSINEIKMIFQSDKEGFNIQIDESFNLVPSQLANGTTTLLCNPSMKLIALSPFEWVQKPGKPGPSYPLLTKDFELQSPLENTIALASPFACPREKNGTQDERGMNFESDLEAFSFKINELPSSVTSLQANRSIPLPPTKLNSSITFQWEGKPQCNYHLQSPAHSEYVCDNDDNDSGNGNNSDDKSETITECDPETFSFHIHESFSSEPSMMANRLLPRVAIASAVPVLETMPTSPGYESDSSMNSYGTGTTSLVGELFLERLFPMLSPKLSFHEKVACPQDKIENSFIDRKRKLQSNILDCDSSFSVTTRTPMTLGELIMMRRKNSHLRKAGQVRKLSSMESMKERLQRIEGLQRKLKRKLQLKRK